jgi:hypothetical protein
MHQDYLQGVPVPSCFRKKIIFSVILGGTTEYHEKKKTRKERCFKNRMRAFHFFKHPGTADTGYHALPLHFLFPELLRPITPAAMRTVIINVVEPGAFNLESQYFILYLIKFHDFAEQQPGGDEASNEGCNSGPTGQ